jgi:hypothetical protein
MKSVSTRFAWIAVFVISLAVRFVATLSQTPSADAAGTWSSERDAAGMSDEMSVAWTPTGQPIVHLFRRDFGADREVTLTEDQKEGTVSWDGIRLKGPVVIAVHSNPATTFFWGRQVVDIDLVFDRTQARWTGTLTRDGDTRRVEYRRSIVVPGTMERFERLLGTWCPSGDVSPQCLTVTRETEGLLAQVYYGAPAFWGKRDSQLIRVAMLDTGRVVMEEIFGICCGNKFSGYLSDDGTQIEGRWIGGKTWSTSEPVRYVRMK